MKSLVTGSLALMMTGAAHAVIWVPTSYSVPTLGELTMVGLAIVVGVLGGKLSRNKKR